MAKTSKLFHISVAFLVVLIVGLVAAIYYQRQSISRSQLKERLLLDSRRMEVLSEKAKLVTPHIELLENKTRDLGQQLSEVQNRLYAPSNRIGIESYLADITKAARLELSGIEDVAIDEKPVFREHVLNVRMSGPMKNLPVWADRFFQQSTIARIDRISIVSPDYQFQRVKLKATIRYFEARDLFEIIPAGMDLDRFKVDLSYLRETDDSQDPVYGEALADARKKADILLELKKNLNNAATLERRIAGIEKISSDAERLAQQMAVNRDVVLENIPTLYIRVRNSPLGSAALLIQGEDTKFPEISGDD